MIFRIDSSSSDNIPGSCSSNKIFNVRNHSLLLKPRGRDIVGRCGVFIACV